MTKQELLTLKQRIENSKTKAAELKGEQKGFLTQLKEFNCGSIESARKLVEQKEAELQELDSEISESIEDLEERYNKIKNEG